MEGKELAWLLKGYAESNHPRAKITYLRLALAKAMVIAPEYKEELKALKKRLQTISSQTNWEAFVSYSMGRWEAVKDEELFVFTDLMTELDDIAQALMTIYEKQKAEILKILEEGVK